MAWLKTKIICSGFTVLAQLRLYPCSNPFIYLPIFDDARMAVEALRGKVHRKEYRPILRHGNSFHSNYQGWQINLGDGKTGTSDSYRDIVDGIIQFADWADLIGKVFVLRFDLMLDSKGTAAENSASRDIEAQKVISDFCDRVNRYLTKKVKQPRDERQLSLRNHKYAPISWVREYCRKKGFHYHCYIILDGKKISTVGQSADGITSLRSLLEHYWEKAVIDCLKQNGDLLANPYVHINSGNKRACYLIPASGSSRIRLIRDVIYHLSYLAKVRSKGFNEKLGCQLHTHRIKVPAFV